MKQVNIHEAKTHLSRYAKKVKQGETIILCDRNRPFAEIRPLPQTGSSEKKRRKLGQLKGLCPVPPSFFEADEALSAAFYGDLASASRGDRRKR